MTINKESLKFFTEKFNDPTYQPTNFFVDNDMDVDMDLLDVKPGQRPVAFRKDTNLKGRRCAILCYLSLCYHLRLSPPPLAS
jgi:hypothetical protein